jgi:molybdenum cofactor cytidylyltransferase
MLQAGSAAAPGARFIPVLNKMDLLKDRPSLQKLGTALGEGIKAIAGTERMLFSTLRDEVAVKFVLRRRRAKETGKELLSVQTPQAAAFAPAVSCVILAAGSGERMRLDKGEDKLLLPLGGKTILEHVIDNALRAEGVREIILVTRPRSKKTVTELLRDKNVQLITNPRCREGMASSLQAGLAAVHPAAQAILFALGDQPFITPFVYDALIGSYAKNWNLITAPLYRGKRGNPVLLDRRLWPMLMQMHGDTGGRELFSRVAAGQITLLELKTAGVLQDIDTPEDLISP